jgi:hypothetical protein
VLSLPVAVLPLQGVAAPAAVLSLPVVVLPLLLPLPLLLQPAAGAAGPTLPLQEERRPLEGAQVAQEVVEAVDGGRCCPAARYK